MAKIMYPGNTQIISVTITDTSKNLLTGATVTCNLVDGTLVNVPNCTNVSMTEVDSVNQPGVYAATISSAFSPPVATDYTLQVSASKSGAVLYGEASVTVEVRVIT